MSQEDIAMYTGVSQRKIADVISTFNKTGTVKVCCGERHRRHGSLGDDDIQVRSCYPYA